MCLYINIGFESSEPMIVRRKYQRPLCDNVHSNDSIIIIHNHRMKSTDLMPALQPKTLKNFTYRNQIPNIIIMSKTKRKRKTQKCESMLHALHSTLHTRRHKHHNPIIQHLRSIILNFNYLHIHTNSDFSFHFDIFINI